MSTVIDRPGVYAQLSLERYIADPCPAPSLSASIAHVLLTASPRHAWTAHPKLNPAWQPDHAEAADVGSAAHAYILGGDQAIEVIDAADWRSPRARAEREVARQAGRVPILRARWEDVQRMAEALEAYRAGFQDSLPLLDRERGRMEVTWVWQEDGVWLRARPDCWIADRRAGVIVDEYKTTEATASPDAWARRLWDLGYDVQIGMYLRGLRALCGLEGRVRLIVQETRPPYAVSVLELGAPALALAQAKVERAIGIWRECLTTDTWPAYQPVAVAVEPPPWELARWESRLAL